MRSSATPSSSASTAAWKRIARACAARATSWCSIPRRISSSTSRTRAAAANPRHERAGGRDRVDARDRGHPAFHRPDALARDLPQAHRDVRRADPLRRPALDARGHGHPVPHMRRWLLPEHIEDVLPAEARAIERLRRAILDLFEVHGYELVAPPLLEYVESLL